MRDRRVRDTVAYAAKHVPYYRDLFGQGGLDPREIQSADDLARLPVVSREEVRADSGRFRSDDSRAQGGLMLRSSGTTGLPLELYHDRNSVLLNVAYGERERAIEVAFAGKRFRYTRLYLGSDSQENVDRVRGFMASTSFRPLRPRYVRGSLAAAAERVYELIDAVRPTSCSVAARISKRSSESPPSVEGQSTGRRHCCTRGTTCRRVAGG